MRLSIGTENEGYHFHVFLIVHSYNIYVHDGEMFFREFHGDENDE